MIYLEGNSCMRGCPKDNRINAVDWIEKQCVYIGIFRERQQQFELVFRRIGKMKAERARGPLNTTTPMSPCGLVVSRDVTVHLLGVCFVLGDAAEMFGRTGEPR